MGVDDTPTLGSGGYAPDTVGRPRDEQEPLLGSQAKYLLQPTPRAPHEDRVRASELTARGTSIARSPASGMASNRTNTATVAPPELGQLNRRRRQLIHDLGDQSVVCGAERQPWIFSPVANVRLAPLRRGRHGVHLPRPTTKIALWPTLPRSPRAPRAATEPGP